MIATGRGRRGDPARRSARERVSRVSRFLGEVDSLLGTDLAQQSAITDRVDAAVDPDAAALGLLRIVESAVTAQAEELLAVLRDPDGRHVLLQRLLTVAGASEALTDHVVRHPDSALALREEGLLALDVPDTAAEALRDALLEAVGADPDRQVAAPVAAITGEEGIDALRRAYRDVVLRLAADDLEVPAPEAVVDEVSRVLSDLAGAAVEAALAIARAELDPTARVRMAVIAMGKCGARELNYVSDVDVVYAHAPTADAPADAEAPDEDAVRVAESMVARITEIVGAPGREPALWELDAALRPEGKSGRLLRTVEEFDAYYQDVAESWEFQALLKARPIAGDVVLGRDFSDALRHHVWSASEREGFVEGVRAMRRRVVALLPTQHADAQIKLGTGGLRDVEFSAQLLQLVHGGADESIRAPQTLLALARLGERGYIGREDAEGLETCYRFLRVVEHRLQLPRLLRASVVPELEDRRRRLARSVYARGERTMERLDRELAGVRRRVRSYHEQIFYRPILAAASAATAVTSLSPVEARQRLAAFGYRDTKAALAHIQALSAGVSRAAVIHRQVLPAMLDWLSAGVNPDAGLLAFRQLGESMRDSGWYLRLLRDSGTTVRSLATILSGSVFATGLLQRTPAAVEWINEATALEPRDRTALEREASTLVSRHGAEAQRPLRALYGRELLRTALADVLERVDVRETGTALSRNADVYLHGLLTALREEMDGPDVPPYEFAVIAMGRLGGAEIGYYSDADVMFVHRPLTPPGEDTASTAGTDLAKHVKRLALAFAKAASQPGAHPGIVVDSDLRPEGRSGPLVRSLDSYRAYYAKWSEPWEAQALLRARPIAGDTALREDFLALIDPLRRPAEVPEASVRQMRRLKARMEAERLPRGADRNTHLKLGRGGLSDVEWTVQLIQLRHGHEVPGLRTTSTLPALHAATEAGLIGAEDAAVLEEAWLLVSGLRSAAMLLRGRTVESLPADPYELEACARLLGYEAGHGRELAEDYLSATRRARRVVERLFFDFDDTADADDPWAGRHD